MPIVKKLVFGKGLVSPTLEGQTTVTYRKYRSGAHDFKKGEVVIGNFMDGFDILIKITEDTDVKPFSELTDEEAINDGRESADKAFEDLQEGYYHDLKKSDLLARIRFQALRYKGTPVVGFNEYTE